MINKLKTKKVAPDKNKSLAPTGRSRRSLAKMPIYNKEIGARVIRLKKQHDLTFGELGELCNCSSGFISSIAYGRVSINIHILRTLKEKLGISYEWLIDGKEEPTKDVAMSKEIKEITALIAEAKEVIAATKQLSTDRNVFKKK